VSQGDRRHRPGRAGWTLRPDDLAAAAKATGQTILGLPLYAAAEAIPAAYLNGPR
jgi:hypothetical protein